MSGVSQTSVSPPPLTAGKVRCPVCRNAVTTTETGRLRRHNDLFGNQCWNKAADADRVPVVAPPIVLPKPRRHKLPKRSTSRRAEGEPSRLDVGSDCRECGKWLPGERSLCGACYARSSR